MTKAKTSNKTANKTANTTSKKRVTIKTVAEDAGVSVSAVSKVLRDAYGVSDKLRERVEASMARLDYRPSVSARGMRGKSYTIGVLMSDISNEFFSDIVEGINAVTSVNNYRALIGLSGHLSSREVGLFDAMVDRQMDGVITIGPQANPRKMYHEDLVRSDFQRAAEHIPTVAIAYYDDSGIFDTVNCDDFAGAKMAVSHLVQQGYERITFLSPGTNRATPVVVSEQRELGYLESMREHGLEKYIEVYAVTETFRGRARPVVSSIDELFARKNRPEALFCWSDLFAFDVLSSLLTLGYDVPTDVGIIGFDDTHFCSLYQNSLTSVNQDGERLGRLAAEILLNRINGKRDIQHVTIEPTLSIRRSTQKTGSQS